MGIVFKHLVAVSVAFFSAAGVPGAAEGSHVIWFDTPNSLKGSKVWTLPSSGAQNPDPEWESASLPIGNGFLGANIMGSVSTERITLNEKSLWRGGPGVEGGATYYWDANKESSDAVGRIREAFAAGDAGKAASLTAASMNGKASYAPEEEEPFRFGSFTTLGEISVETGADDEDISGYRRSLYLDDAVALVNFMSDGVEYRRSFFVSYPDRALVMRFSADSPMERLRLVYVPGPEAEGETVDDRGASILYSGKLKSNGMKFALRVSAVLPGEGRAAVEDGGIVVEDTKEAVFIVTAGTDYRMNFNPDFTDSEAYVGENPVKTTGESMKKAMSYTWDELLFRHLTDYHRLYDRAGLTLGTGPDPSLDSLTTPERLARYRTGEKDYGLEELYFQFGRYLLISSSRPGAMPANLQGIWHNGTDGPWHVDYHNNINIQMNYWPALVTGLDECYLPLIDYIRTLEKPGERVARSYFGARGWTASISGNIFGFASPLSSTDMSWNLIPVAGPWLAVHLWEYYRYTQDTDWLCKTGFPLIRGSADFMVDYLWKSPDGTYMACPSTSPEHGPVDKGVTFAHAVAREILGDAVKAAVEVGYDGADRERWQNVLDSLAPYRIGRYGQLMEWSEDIDDPADEHRHVNHLFGLHPGSTISPVTTPELAEAARVVLEHRGDLATGWSMAWKLNQWARLHDGDHAYRLLRNLLSEGTTSNLWCIHPPFQIDGNFGGCAGIAEMLMQSHSGFIHLLPALPEEWDRGSARGLRAAGGFSVTLRWQEGRLTGCDIYSDAGNKCVIYYGGKYMEFPTGKGEMYRLAAGPDGDLYYMALASSGKKR